MSETAITTETPVVPPVAATEEPKKVVTLTVEEHAKMLKDIEDARTLQGQADQRAARLQLALSGGKGAPRFTPPGTAPAAPTEQERADYAAEEDRKAAQGMQRLALDPAYREALDADPTLRGLFQNNPLAVLPLLAPTAFDAEDAISLVKTALGTKVAAIKALATPPKPADIVPPANTPPAGATAPTAPIVDEEYEAAKKLPNTESALRSMIGIGLKKLGGKNGS